MHARKVIWPHHIWKRSFFWFDRYFGSNKERRFETAVRKRAVSNRPSLKQLLRLSRRSGRLFGGDNRFLCRRGRRSGFNGNGRFLGGRRWCGRFGHRARWIFPRRAGRLLPILLDEAAHRIRRLCPLGNPMIDPIQLQGAVRIGLLRIVSPDNLDKFSIARAAAVRHDHLVVRAIPRAFSA